VERYQRLMIAHGLLVILVAMLAGFMLMFDLIGGIEVWPGTIIAVTVYGTSDGWVRAHSGGTMNGLLVVVMAMVLPKLALSPRLQAWTAWGGFSGGGYIRGNFIWTRVDDFTEKGASGMELRVSGVQQESLVSVVGLRGAYAVSTPIGVLLPQARVEWEHEYLQNRQSINHRYAQDTANTVFTVKGNAPDRDYGNAGASLSLVLEGGWIKVGGIAVLEEDARSEIELPAGYEELDRRTYGDTQILIMRAIEG